MLVTSIFSFSYNVFNSFLAQSGKCGSTLQSKSEAFLTLPNKPWFLCVFSKSFFGNTVEKGEIAHNEHFFSFP